MPPRSRAIVPSGLIEKRMSSAGTTRCRQQCQLAPSGDKREQQQRCPHAVGGWTQREPGEHRARAGGDALRPVDGKKRSRTMPAVAARATGTSGACQIEADGCSRRASMDNHVDGDWGCLTRDARTACHNRARWVGSGHAEGGSAARSWLSHQGGAARYPCAQRGGQSRCFSRNARVPRRLISWPPVKNSISVRSAMPSWA